MANHPQEDAKSGGRESGNGSSGFHRGFLLSKKPKQAKRKNHGNKADPLEKIKVHDESTTTQKDPTATPTTTSTSMRRGFLLSQPKTRKTNKAPKYAEKLPPPKKAPPPVKTSSALLDLETKENSQQNKTTASTTRSLLFVTGNDNDDHDQQHQNSSSIIQLQEQDPQTLLDANDNNPLGITEISSSSTIQRHKHGVSLISDLTPGDGIESSSSPPLIIHNPRHDEEAEPIIDNSPVVSENNTNKSSTPESTTSHTLLEEQQTVFRQCQHDLDQTLWRLRRKPRRKKRDDSHSSDNDDCWRKIALDFCAPLLLPQQQNLEMLGWVWECLVAACPKESSSNLAERRLGSVFLEQIQTPAQWDIVSYYLSPSRHNNDNKEGRVLALGAISILDYWSSRTQNISGSQLSSKWMMQLLECVVAPLEQLVTASSTRTVLAQRATMTMYKLLALAAEYCHCSSDENNSTELLQQTIWKLSSTCLIPVWKAHCSWINNSEDQALDSMEACRSAAQKHCQTAVLRDWIRTIQALEDDDKEEDASAIWLNVLHGIPIMGGQEIPTIRMGSLQQTLIKPYTKLSAETIVHYLTQAAQQEPTEEDATTQQKAIVRGVVAWLGQGKQHISGILDSQQRDHSESGEKVSLYQQAHDAANALLRHALSESVVDLTLEIFDILWTDSFGLPPDLIAFCDQHNKPGPIQEGQEHHVSSNDTTVQAQEEEIPASLKEWIKCLRGEGESLLPASCEALCTLVAQSIVELCLGTNTAGLSLSKRAIAILMEPDNEITRVSVQVLVTVLKMLQVSATSAYGEKGDQNRQELLEYVGANLLLGNLETNEWVQEAFQTEQAKLGDLLSECSVDTIVPVQIRLLVTLTESSAVNAQDVISIVALSLSASLWKSLSGGRRESDSGSDLSNAVVTETVQTLMSVMDDIVSHSRSPESEDSRISKTQLLENVCSYIGKAWRHCLLKGNGRNEVKTADFGSVLTFAGREMFRFPSSTVPLALLGAIIGDSLSYEEEDANLEAPVGDRQTSQSILSAAISLMELIVEELDRFQVTHDSDATADADKIFCRLAPLLLLRRIPPSFFRAAYKERYRGRQDCKDSKFNELLSRLATHLADRLDIGTIEAPSSTSDTIMNVVVFSAEERQMAAEVAARCLPFNEADSATEVKNPSDNTTVEDKHQAISCFQRICVPSFSSLLNLLQGSDNNCDDNKSLIRRARAALYAACHFIPFTKRCDNQSIGDALLSTAGFCIHCLNAEQERFESTGLEQDWLQLQTGCIEFFAVCFERLHSFRSCPKSGAEDPSSGMQLSLEEIQETVSEIVRDAKAPQITKKEKNWLETPIAFVSRSDIHQTRRRHIQLFSVACRTCLWNSLIVLSQRCPEEDGKLKRLAETTLPWLVTWASSNNKEELLRQHPLCLTASMQLAFILITRTKSFAGLSGSSDIQGLLRWALRAIQEGRASDDYANNALRSGGLKLLLAIATIGQVSNNTSSLVFSPRDLKETAAVLKEISSRDPDPKLQSLANHVLGAGLIC